MFDQCWWTFDRLCTETSSNLVYSTTHSVITILDLRTMRVLQTMTNPRHFGPITTMCLDRKRSWIVVGTSTGVMTLWDRRFGLLLKSWHVGIASNGRPVRIHQCAVHPTKGRGKWVMVAVEASRLGMDHSPINLIEVWDVERATLVETFVTTISASSEAVPEPHELAAIDADANPAAAIATLVRSRQDSKGNHSRPSSQSTFKENIFPGPAPDIRTMVVGVDFGGHPVMRSSANDLITDMNSSSRSVSRGFVVSGSEDRKIRLWDLGNLERSFVFGGVESEEEKPSFR